MAKGSGLFFSQSDFRGKLSGVVADIVETDEMHELALESVMDAKLQYVICS